MAMDAVGLVIQGYRNRRQQSCVVPCNHSKKAPQHKLQLSKEQSAATLHRKTFKSLQNPPPLQRIVCNSPQNNMCTIFKEHDLPHSLTPGNSCCRCNKQAMILEVSTSCSLAQLTYAQTLWLFLNQSAASTCFWIASSENFPPTPSQKNNQEALSHEVGRLE
jgi:hypothetical protein